MPKLSIDLEWRRDPNAHGYRLVAARPAKKRRPSPAPSRAVVRGLDGETLLTRDLGLPELDPERIVRAGGGALSPYHPLLEFPTLHAIFAKVDTPEALLAFVNKFGPLTPAGLGKRGEETAPLLVHADAMRHWLDAQKHVDDDIAQLIRPAGLPLGNVSASMVADPLTQRPRIRLAIDSLLSGLWLQLAQALSKSVAVVQCLHCSILFEVGPGSGRRADAKFCCNEHRTQFHVLQRGTKKGNHHG